MEDIVERLRHWSHGLTYDPAAGLMHEAADEIERLRNGAAEGRETATLADDERDAIERLRTHATHATQTEGSKRNGCTLTAEERAAIEWAACEADVEHSATLRNLLERTK
jgi:hypothetical protein